jgi:hypothetical protein
MVIPTIAGIDNPDVDDLPEAKPISRLVEKGDRIPPYDSARQEREILRMTDDFGHL